MVDICPQLICGLLVKVISFMNSSVYMNIFACEFEYFRTGEYYKQADQSADDDHKGSTAGIL